MINLSKKFTQPLILMGFLLLPFSSCEKEDPLEPPTLTTITVTEITGNTAISGGNITEDGGASVTSRGVVWSTSENPTINNKEGSTSDGIGDGQFVSNLTGLSSGTTYYVRAYAVNSAGTAYGNQEQFKTVDLASVNTAGITEITSRSATSGGNVTDDGGAVVTARGIIWGMSHNPTVESNIGNTTDGSGTGSFVSKMTELSPGTTYYVRAYATNIESTSYGDQMEFSTDAELATVTTAEVTDITATSAISGGNVTDNGGAEVTSRGVVWSTDENPTINNNDGYTEDGEGTGEFTSEMEGLLPEVTYYVRAYVSNIVGASYGDQIIFSTYPEDGKIGNVTDIKGNLYNTVWIGGREWMSENLRTSKYNNGIDISTGHTNSEWSNLTTGAYAIYPHTGGDAPYDENIEGINSDEEVLIAYGALYNWYAVETGNLCPTDWHVPSDDEWALLIDYLMSTYDLTNNWDDINGIGNNLKSCLQVNSPVGGNCNTTYHPRWESDEIHFGTNTYGYSALPGGVRRGSNGNFELMGVGGYWWSRTDGSNSYPWLRSIGRGNGDLNRHFGNKTTGLSIRCIRDKMQK